jgi:hypothetical protein
MGECKQRKWKNPQEMCLPKRKKALDWFPDKEDTKLV